MLQIIREFIDILFEKLTSFNRLVLVLNERNEFSEFPHCKNRMHINQMLPHGVTIVVKINVFFAVIRPKAIADVRVHQHSSRKLNPFTQKLLLSCSNIQCIVSTERLKGVFKALKALSHVIINGNHASGLVAIFEGPCHVIRLLWCVGMIDRIRRVGNSSHKKTHQRGWVQKPESFSSLYSKQF